MDIKIVLERGEAQAAYRALRREASEITNQSVWKTAYREEAIYLNNVVRKLQKSLTRDEKDNGE